jgi:hypothetical protein
MIPVHGIHACTLAAPCTLQGISKRISMVNTEEATLRQGKRVAALFSSLTVAAAERLANPKPADESRDTKNSGAQSSEEEVADDSGGGLDEVYNKNDGDLQVCILLCFWG